METQVHRLVVPRAARFVTLGELDGDPAEVWFLCHGYGQLASEFLESARALESSGRVLVAPEALSRFYLEDHVAVGASWMTREDRENEMEDYIRCLDLIHDQLFELVERSAVRVVVLGFSQGAATAARWAVHGRGDVDRLILWGAAMPPELEDETTLTTLRSLRLTLVSGSRDKIFPESAHSAHCSRLQEKGVPFTELSFEGGHRMDDATLQNLAESPARMD